jgi:hypothetical protein
VTRDALAGISFTTPALAQAAAPAAAPEPAATTIAVTAGADFPTLYFFRGIRQEGDADLTLQPFVDLGVTTGAATVNVGPWNSFHSGSNNEAYGGAWYESDLYASVGVVAGAFSPKVLYTAYTSPKDGFGTVHELAFSTGFDDSASSKLAPSVTLAFELGDNGADGGTGKGIYLELGVTPAIPMKDGAKVSLSVPVKLGLSVKDYYENPLTGEDSTFGYFSAGLAGKTALSPHVDLHGSVLVYAFGDRLKLGNDDNSSRVAGSIGIGLAF